MSAIKTFFKKRSEKKQRSSTFYDDQQLENPETGMDSVTKPARVASSTDVTMVTEGAIGHDVIPQKKSLNINPIYSMVEKEQKKPHVLKSKAGDTHIGDTVSLPNSKKTTVTAKTKQHVSTPKPKFREKRYAKQIFTRPKAPPVNKFNVSKPLASDNPSPGSTITILDTPTPDDIEFTSYRNPRKVHSSSSNMEYDIYEDPDNSGKAGKQDFPFVLTGGHILPSDMPKEKLSKYMPSSKSLVKAKQKLKPLTDESDIPDEREFDRNRIENVLQEHLQQKLIRQAMKSAPEPIDIGALSVAELLEKMETEELSLNDADITHLRERFLNMTTQEKRQYYKCGNDFLISQQIPSWQDTGQMTSAGLSKSSDGHFDADAVINDKVALWHGDITRLEMDAIVNSTSSLLMDERQGVNAVICMNAGPIINYELNRLWQVFAGEIAITNGYCLPAKFVIHTSGPPSSWKDKEEILGRCYMNALDAMKENGLRTMAIPCISTGAKGLQSSVSAIVALKTTRLWLEENHSHVDKIVFCIYDDRNLQTYRELMPEIFPVRPSSGPKLATLPAEIMRMDGQSIQLYKKALSEGETSVHSIRVMVVGHYGVGKTTLTRRLLEEDVDLDARDSTNGIDVHVRRCRVSLADQSWTVLKKDEKVDTVFKKLAEVLSRQSSSETKNEPVRSEGGLDEVDASVASITSPHEHDEDTTALKTVADTQTNTVVFDELHIADVEEKIDIVEEAVESDMSENAVLNMLKDLKDLISNVGTSDDEDFADLSIWDFAGQCIFYATHQMFLSSRAIYLLVTDISKHIDDVVGDDECYFDSKGAESYKISEFVNFWLNSIHGYCPSGADNVPPIILIGTHSDGLDQATKEEQENKYFEAVRNIFDEKVTAMHVVDADFSINNAIIDPNLDKLKQKIFEVATRQDYWGERIPVNWLTLERALGQLRDKGLKIITHSKLMDVNNSMPVPIASDEYLDLFLRFQHESANILYFNDPDLRGNILLDPQWLIDCLKSLITAKMFCSRRPQILKQWKELSRDGILRPNLIDAVWQQEGNQSFQEHRDHLVLLMEKLNIIAPSDGDDSGPYHLVPCMLKDPPTTVCIKSDCVTTPVLCITTADGFLPAGIFQRLLAACIAKWNISKQGKKNLIYCGYGCFDVDAFHRVTLYFRDCVIQMWVSSYSEKHPHPSADVCTQVRVYVLQALQRINTRLSLTQLSNLKLSIKCLSKDLEELDGQFSVEDLLTHHMGNDEIVCHAHEESSHSMVCSELLRHWYGNDLISIHDNHHLSVLSPYALEKVPSDKQLNQIASKIGKEYERLGLELGLPQVEIDQIKIDNPHHVVTWTVHILLSWRRKNASRATFRILEQAMVTVHIDAAEALAGIK